MKYLQFINLTQENKYLLENYYQNNENHDLRQRAHMVLLRWKEFSASTISKITNRSDNEVVIYIKAWDYFGESGLLENDLDLLVRKIENIEKSTAEQKSWWEYFKQLFISIFSNIYHFFSSTSNAPVSNSAPEISWNGFFSRTLSFFKVIVNMIFYPLTITFHGFLGVFSLLSSIKYKERLRDNTSDQKGLSNIMDTRGNNNICIQIISNNGEKEYFEAESLKEYIDDLKQIRDRESEFAPEDKRYAWFVAAMNRFKQYPRIQYAFLVVFAIYMYYNTLLKGGILFVGILGSTIMVNLHNNVQEPIVPIIQQPQITTIANIKLPEDVFFDTFSPSNECIYLADTPRKNSQEIENDTTDYTKKEYFVEDKDEKVYLQVAAYEKVQQAAFQRRNLIKQGFNSSQVIKIEKASQILFGVTIGVAEQSDISTLSSIQAKWNKVCKTERVKALIKLNQ